MKDRSTRYCGERALSGAWMVTTGGISLDARPARRLRERLGTSFEWGHAGGGALLLGLAILLDYFEDRRRALDLCRDFTYRVIAQWLADQSWVLTGVEIEMVVLAIENGRRAIW